MCAAGSNRITVEPRDTETGPSRITRRVRLAEDVDGIAGLQIAAGQGRKGIKREIADRDRADRVEQPGGNTLHVARPRIRSPRCAGPSLRRGAATATTTAAGSG